MDNQDDRMITMPESRLREICDTAGERGGDRALQKIGLENGQAAKDVAEIRSLAQSLRAARSTAWQTVVRVFTAGILALILAGIAVKTKLFG